MRSSTYLPANGKWTSCRFHECKIRPHRTVDHGKRTGKPTKHSIIHLCACSYLVILVQAYHSYASTPRVYLSSLIALVSTNASVIATSPYRVKILISTTS